MAILLHLFGAILLIIPLLIPHNDASIKGIGHGFV